MDTCLYDLERLRGRVRGLRGRYQELSDAAGVSGSWLSKFGRGDYESPRLGTVIRLARALDVLEGRRPDDAVSVAEEKAA